MPTVKLQELVIEYRVDTSKAQRGFNKISAGATGAGKNVKGLTQGMGGLGTSLSRFATPAVAAGAGIAAIGAAAFSATKQAIEFESAFAGIRKTVEATEPGFARLRSQILQLSTEIPVTATELAKIGEIGGQLGVGAENIVGFTRTIADLGVASNLSGEEGATMIARFANITGVPQDKFENIASSIVDLGNNSATTEADIAAMALRISGAATAAGATAGDILGFSAALSSVGINAEAGGTSLSKFILELQNQVATGGEKLEGFAAISGQTAEQFKQSFEADATGAIVSFVEGLGQFQAEGGKAAVVFENLGIKGVRLQDALQRMALNSDGLRESIERGNTAFRENTALAEEAEKRYATTESKLILLGNAVSALAIEIGSELTPAVAASADGMTTWVNAIRESFTALTQLDARLAETAKAKALIEALREIGVTASITAGESIPEFISRLEEMGKKAGLTAADIEKAGAKINKGFQDARKGAAEGVKAFAAWQRAQQLAAVETKKGTVEIGKFKVQVSQIASPLSKLDAIEKQLIKSQKALNKESKEGAQAIKDLGGEAGKAAEKWKIWKDIQKEIIFDFKALGAELKEHPPAVADVASANEELLRQYPELNSLTVDFGNEMQNLGNELQRLQHPFREVIDFVDELLLSQRQGVSQSDLYARAQVELQGRLEAGLITYEQWRDAINKVNEAQGKMAGTTKATKEEVAKTSPVLTQVSTAVTNLSRDLVQNVRSFNDLKGAAISLGETLLQVVLENAIKPLVDQLTNVLTPAINTAISKLGELFGIGGGGGGIGDLAGIQGNNDGQGGGGFPGLGGGGGGSDPINGTIQTIQGFVALNKQFQMEATLNAIEESTRRSNIVIEKELPIQSTQLVFQTAIWDELKTHIWRMDDDLHAIRMDGGGLGGSAFLESLARLATGASTGPSAASVGEEVADALRNPGRGRGATRAGGAPGPSRTGAPRRGRGGQLINVATPLDRDGQLIPDSTVITARPDGRIPGGRSRAGRQGPATEASRQTPIGGLSGRGSLVDLSGRGDDSNTRIPTLSERDLELKAFAAANAGTGGGLSGVSANARMIVEPLNIMGALLTEIADTSLSSRDHLMSLDEKADTHTDQIVKLLEAIRDKKSSFVFTVDGKEIAIEVLDEIATELLLAAGVEV